MTESTSLISIEELEQQATSRGIQLLHSEETLQTQIDNCQAVLEARTGRVFDEQDITEYHNPTNTAIIHLQKYPISEVTSITFNDDSEITSYNQNPMTGTIFLTVPLPDYGDGNTVLVEYTTTPPPDSGVAKALLADMVLHSFSKPTNEGYIDEENRLNTRLQRLSRESMVIV